MKPSSSASKCREVVRSSPARVPPALTKTIAALRPVFRTARVSRRSSTARASLESMLQSPELSLPLRSRPDGTHSDMTRLPSVYRSGTRCRRTLFEAAAKGSSSRRGRERARGACSRMRRRAASPRSVLLKVLRFDRVFMREAARRIPFQPELGSPWPRRHSRFASPRVERRN